MTNPATGDREPTPGPWTIIPAREYDGDDDDLEGCFLSPASIEGSDGSPVCLFGDPAGSGTLFENEADYHLIAAAPAMLAALKNVRARFQHLRLGPDEEAVLDRVSAALSLAQGKKP